MNHVKNTFRILIFLTVIFSSCKKDSDNSTKHAVDSLGTGWSRVDLGTENAHFIDIFFSGKTGFGAGEKISKSTDEGKTWKVVFRPDHTFVNIAMADAENAIFVSGNSGKIYFTNNGGTSFDSVTISNERIDDVFAVNSTVAYAIGKKFWRTTDAGRHWTSLYNFSEARGYKILYFNDEFNGWVSVPPRLYKTSDGGKNWEENKNSELVNGSIGAIFFYDADNGYVTKGGKLLKTTDGGSSWKIALIADDIIIDIHFVTKDIGYVNTLWCIYKTLDGGINWFREVNVKKEVPDIAIIELHFTDINHGYTSGSTNILKYSR